jgi:hypothetical protein
MLTVRRERSESGSGESGLRRGQERRAIAGKWLAVIAAVLFLLNLATGQALSLQPAAIGSETIPEGFKHNVEARFTAARNGMIEIFLPPSWKANEAVVVTVVLLRPPEGSDGFLPAAIGHSAKLQAAALLKVDDDMEVSLSSKEPGAIQIQPDASRSQGPIRHILPGGHAEWKWRVTASAPGEIHLAIKADVTYPRQFRDEGRSGVIFNSADNLLPVQILP